MIGGSEDKTGSGGEGKEVDDLSNSGKIDQFRGNLFLRDSRGIISTLYRGLRCLNKARTIVGPVTFLVT
jgi:hypothetical protein